MRILILLAAFLLAQCNQNETLTAYGAAGQVWRLTELNGAPVSGTATLEFTADQTMRGVGPCNMFSAKVTAPYPWFELSPILSTRRACPEMALETELLTLLPQLSQAEVSGSVLVLSNEGGQRAVFSSGD